jgi:hypothetical protein
MDNLVFAIGSLSKFAENATVNPCIVSLHQVSSFPWNPCPLWRGIRKSFRNSEFAMSSWRFCKAIKRAKLDRLRTYGRVGDYFSATPKAQIVLRRS